MDWDKRYHEGDTPWDKGEAAPPLREIWSRYGEQVIEWQGRGGLLVPGCGTGHDVRWLATQGVQAYGMDVSARALEIANEQTALEQPEVQKQAKYELGDFFNVRANEAGVIFEHTCFCAIEPSMRENYARSAAGWLQPGGYLVAIFFLTPGVKTGPPFGTTLEELDSLFAADFELVEEWAPQEAYPGREGKEWIRILRRSAVASA